MKFSFSLTGCCAAIAIATLPTAAIAVPGADTLMPLAPSEFSMGTRTSSAAVAADINAELSAAQAPGEDVIDLSALFGDFVNEDGEVSLPMDLPFGIIIVDSFGDQALGIDYHF